MITVTDVCPAYTVCSKILLRKSHVRTVAAYVDMVETAESDDNPIIDLSAELMTSDTAGPRLVDRPPHYCYSCNSISSSSHLVLIMRLMKTGTWCQMSLDWAPAMLSLLKCQIRYRDETRHQIQFSHVNSGTIDHPGESHSSLSLFIFMASCREVLIQHKVFHHSGELR